MKRWTCAVVSLTLLLAGCIGPENPKTAAPRFDAELPYVTAAFLDGQSAPEPADAMADIEQAGFRGVRITVRWSAIEPSRGEFDWSRVDDSIDAAHDQGLAVLAAVTWAPTWAVPAAYSATPHPAPADPEMFAEFAALAAERYRGRVQAWEVWNEPNISASFGPNVDPERYCDLLSRTYGSITRADPDATVIAGGSSPAIDTSTALSPATFVRALYLCAAGSFDAVAMHPYSTPALLSETDVKGSAKDVAEVRAVMVANGDSDAQIWFTEFGAPTSRTWPGVSNARQAEIIRDGVAYLRNLDFAGPVFVFDFRDLDSGNPDPEYNYGVTRSDGASKEALDSLER